MLGFTSVSQLQTMDLKKHSRNLNCLLNVSMSIPVKHLKSYCLHHADAPRLLMEQTNFKSSVGEEIHITCVVEGFPKPNVLWTRFVEV